MLPRRRRIGSEYETPILGGSTPWVQQSSVTSGGYPNNVTDDFSLEETIEQEPVMSARDRTGEFVNTVQTLQGRNIVRAVSAQDPKKSRAIQSHSEFMLVAKNVGRNITSTYEKLEKLTLCMFN